MRRRTSIAALFAALYGLAACTGSSDLRDTAPDPAGSGDAKQPSITVWSAAQERRHITGLERIAAGFTAATGVEVRVEPADQARLGQLATTAERRTNAADDAPDAIGALPLASAQKLAAHELTDRVAVGEVMDDLGPDTFSERALELTSREGEQIAVPSHAWVQLLVYRADLFSEHDLPVPDTFTKVLEAAQRLDRGSVAGIALPTAGDIATTRAFEYLALANGCGLLNRTGDITLDTQPCVETLDYYGTLATHATGADQDAAAVRAAYLAGEAAMMVAPSTVLGDLSGHDVEHAATCDRCDGDPAFLAKNTSVVTALRGPAGTRPAQYGGISAWTITRSADSEPAAGFVTYMLREGYLDWLGLAPGGRIPVRTGTIDEPRRFADAWAALPATPAGTTPLAGLYSPTLLDLVRSTPDDARRWGRGYEDGDLIATMRRELPVATGVHQVVRTGLDPRQAAREADRNVEELRRARPRGGE